MGFDDSDDRRRDIALFRHRVIADLDEPNLPRGELSARVAGLAGKPFVMPDGEDVTFSERTIWDYWGRYDRDGLAGLLPATRKDRDLPRAITPTLLEAAVAVRRDLATRSTRIVIDCLVQQGVVAKGELKRSTLDRHLERAGVSRRQLKTLGDKRYIRMLFERVNQFWVGDYHEAPILWEPTSGRYRKIHLSAFIDHYSKVVPHAQWYTNERIATLEDTFKKAILKRGLPESVYVDWGPAYRSRDFAFALDQFNPKAKLRHSKPYAKEARGAIERWNRTVSEQFEPEIIAAKIADLDRINLLFEAWLEQSYHLTTHEGIGQTPMDRLAAAQFVPRYPDPVEVQDTFRVRVRRKVHKKTCTVEIDGVPFVVETFLRGRWVEVHYDPHRLEDVIIVLRHKRVQRALPQQPNEPPQPTPERPVASPPAFDYLSALRAEYDQRIVAEARKLSLAEWAPSEAFTLPAFLGVCAQLLGKQLSPYERDQFVLAFQTVGPFSETTCRLALEHAMKLRGRGLHVSVYTHYLKHFHFEALRANSAPRASGSGGSP